MNFILILKNDGSLLIIPLKFNRNQVFGILGIDSLQETSNKFFSETDLKFYEGVASTFARSYSSIVFRNRLVKACLSSFEWLTSRCSFVCHIF
jgi:transcriptional regulator with GAF, ATPase, and Fis domain